MHGRKNEVFLLMYVRQVINKKMLRQSSGRTQYWGLVMQEGPWKETSKDRENEMTSLGSRTFSGGGVQGAGKIHAGHAGAFSAINLVKTPNWGNHPRPMPNPSRYAQRSVRENATNRHHRKLPPGKSPFARPKIVAAPQNTEDAYYHNEFSDVHQKEMLETGNPPEGDLADSGEGGGTGGSDNPNMTSNPIVPKREINETWFQADPGDKQYVPLVPPQAYAGGFRGYSADYEVEEESIPQPMEEEYEGHKGQIEFRNDKSGTSRLEKSKGYSFEELQEVPKLHPLSNSVVENLANLVDVYMKKYQKLPGWGPNKAGLRIELPEALSVVAGSVGHISQDLLDMAGVQEQHEVDRWRADAQNTSVLDPDDGKQVPYAFRNSVKSIKGASKNTLFLEDQATKRARIQEEMRNKSAHKIERIMNMEQSKANRESFREHMNPTHIRKRTHNKGAISQNIAIRASEGLRRKHKEKLKKDAENRKKKRVLPNPEYLAPLGRKLITSEAHVPTTRAVVKYGGITRNV